jgi:hypothetical protein
MLWLRNMTCIACHYLEYQHKKSEMDCTLGERREEREKTLET